MITFFKKNYLLIAILLVSFLLRVYSFSFPYFSTEEARVAYRGYTIATSGKDELGRFFPILFNSLEDYQLPAISYLTAGGELIFGKTELGVRIPFILLGTLLVFLIYEIAKFFSKDRLFWYFSAVIVAFSPALIFLSKIPNEAIVLTFLITLLFYLFIKNKSTVLIIVVMVLSLLTSKFSWFILLPMTLFTVTYYLKEVNLKKKLIIAGISAALVFLSFSLFLSAPQAKRSLMENNFSLFTDITIKNGIDKLRGQGLESEWPALLDRALFNKSYFLIVGFLQWLTHLNPALYFGQLDSKGLMNFLYLGSFSKIMIIPALLGFFAIIRNPDRKNKLMVFLLLILTFPAFFIYPDLSSELLVLELPFMAFILALGLTKIGRFNNKLVYIVVFLMIFELVLNFYNFSTEYKSTNVLRPGWVKGPVSDIYNVSKNSQTAISDDLVEDITPMINWYTLEENKAYGQDVPWPYKFRQYYLPNITVIGSEGKFRACGKNEKLTTFLSIRDLQKIQKETNIEVNKTYQDYLDESKIFVVENICLN